MQGCLIVGKRHTLLAIDPDVPSLSVGTKRRPLVHWLRINMRDGDTNTGDELVPYRGPAPPDDKPHFYFFLLFEQDENKDIEKDAYKAYAGANCTERLKYM